MLFSQAHLQGIQDGTITLAFRKWAKPAAKAGSLHKTAIGQIEIVAVDPVLEASITASEAQPALFGHAVVFGQQDRPALPLA